MTITKRELKELISENRGLALKNVWAQYLMLKNYVEEA